MLYQYFITQFTHIKIQDQQSYHWTKWQYHATVSISRCARQLSVQKYSCGKPS